MTSHGPGCCPPPSCFAPRERTRCLDRTTTSDVCSHGNGPECLDNGPCSAYVDGYPTSIRRKLKKLDQAGAYMDVDTHECFRVTSDQGLESLYPKLPSKKLRVKGGIYELTCGRYVRWNGKQLRTTCRDCVIKQASYPDEEGKPSKLCASCSERAGTKIVQKPCRDCPDGKKKVASYPDEEGKPNKLCGPCSERAGSKIVRFPCRDCPDGEKKQGHYPDEEGKPNKLCARCCFHAGLKPQATSGASMVACRCWHRLEAVSQAKLTHHICCMNATKWTGDEKKGLLPDHPRVRPDAYVEPHLPIHLDGETSGPKGAVYLFHGNEWHGYPKGHPKYDGENHYGASYKEMYDRTMAQHQLYKSEGYRVFVVWEHEYIHTTRVNCPTHVLNVVREVEAT